MTLYAVGIAIVADMKRRGTTIARFTFGIHGSMTLLTEARYAGDRSGEPAYAENNEPHPRCKRSMKSTASE